VVTFAAGAAAAFAAFAWRAWGRYGVAWLLAEAAFVAAVLEYGARPFVVFAGLFVIPTAVFGIVSVIKKTAGPLFLICASSDLALMVGFTFHHAQTFSWSPPAPGAWSAGAVAVAVAAALRLSSAGPFGSREAAALGSVGWWQGAALAWWAGGSARPASVLFGAALLAAGAATLGLSKKGSEASLGRRPAMLVAGGLVMLLSASGINIGVGTWTAELALASLGLAAAATALGARSLPAWALAALPLSAATLHSPAGGLVSPLVAATFLALIPLWAWVALRLATLRPGPGGTTLAFFSIAATLPLAIQSIGSVWTIAVLIVAVAAGFLVRPAEQASAPEPSETPGAIPSWLAKPVDQIRNALPAQPSWMPKLAPLFGLAPLTAALVLLGRLTALGLSTRFL
jgi:hypothetical protein